MGRILPALGWVLAAVSARAAAPAASVAPGPRLYVTTERRQVYVTTGRGGTVVTIDAATDRPTVSLEVGARPWGIAIGR